MSAFVTQQDVGPFKSVNVSESSFEFSLNIVISMTFCGSTYLKLLRLGTLMPFILKLLSLLAHFGGLCLELKEI